MWRYAQADHTSFAEQTSEQQRNAYWQHFVCCLTSLEWVNWALKVKSSPGARVFLNVWATKVKQLLSPKNIFTCLLTSAEMSFAFPLVSWVSSVLWNSYSYILLTMCGRLGVVYARGASQTQPPLPGNCIGCCTSLSFLPSFYLCQWYN